VIIEPDGAINENPDLVLRGEKDE